MVVLFLTCSSTISDLVDMLPTYWCLLLFLVLDRHRSTEVYLLAGDLFPSLRSCLRGLGCCKWIFSKLCYVVQAAALQRSIALLRKVLVPSIRRLIPIFRWKSFWYSPSSASFKRRKSPLFFFTGILESFQRFLELSVVFLNEWYV